MDKERLERIIPVLAQQHNFRLEVVEKDYYLTVILNNIESGFGDKLIFKGGTLLNKIHLNYHRLSEDLDFTFNSSTGLDTRSKRSRAIEPIRKKMRSFLASLNLKSKSPEGEGFNNSTQYVFNILYPSFITGEDENVKIEISLRQPPIDKLVYNLVKHFYKDPFTNKDLIPSNKILSLSLKEAVAEKLKAALTRRNLAIRDYYDLWHIAETKFDFQDAHFVSLFKKKLKNEGYTGDYSKNFGLREESMSLLRHQIATELMPVIRLGEKFELEKLFARFNKIFK
ncbi:MAG: nucleotidyl transferase AbiEii/AbiGii toxin family protein [Candidatus Pacearchaeota archaeon]|nr:nucleotidyl transferase AbiEii/AbiGii toxin family protein [Candidatus Pacearchaeota archaeon]